ncbi:MAG TPA: hypothetical protein VFB74_19380 [Kribbellaceae bacterium]|nr:hypothetical protein [Kribbellaceae bacterium]
MNDLDLESRLRDALHAAAKTVPDHATGPGLPMEARTAHHLLRRTVVVLATAAAVVAAVAVPFAIRAMTDRTAPVTGPVCPGPVEASTPIGPATPRNTPAKSPDGKPGWSDKLPAGAPPRVPFTVTDSRGAGYLQDGTVRVRLAADQDVYVLQRLACGWLVHRSEHGPTERAEIGVLLPDGRFTGRGRGRAAALSPDRTKIAVADRGRVIVTDLDTGDEVAGIPYAADAIAYAWNTDGIWIGYEFAGRYRLSLWQPGSPPRQIHWNGGDVFPVRDGRLLLAPEDPPCIRVLRLGSTDALEKVMERCAAHLNGGSLSPDGRLLVTNDGRGYHVPENTSTKFAAPRDEWLGADWFGPRVWEDDTHVLLTATIGESNATGRLIIVRCDAVTGACERVYDADRRTELSLPPL